MSMTTARSSLPVLRMLLTAIVAAGLLLGPLTAEAAHDEPELVHCAEQQCSADPGDHHPSDGHEHHKAHGCSSCHLHIYAGLIDVPDLPISRALTRMPGNGDGTRLASPDGPLRPPRV